MSIENVFRGVFDTATTAVISPAKFLLCIAVSLLIGGMIVAGYVYKTRYTKSFVVTLAILPAVVCVVIMMVNGNVGAGVAVAGAFSLVRFRSVPGTAREIGTLFLAMGAGLITGMGYLAYAVLFTLILSGAFFLYNLFDLGAKRASARHRTLRITVPEELDYTGVFDGILAEYASSYELTRVKTTNLGSMYRLTYSLVLRDPAREREMIDRLRERNGNLEISLSATETAREEL